MLLENVDDQLATIIKGSIEKEARNWLNDKVDMITKERSTRELYLTYSLIPSKIPATYPASMDLEETDVKRYLEGQKANLQQLARIFLLNRVLDSDHDFFSPKVANIIQIADTGELETFLKFLVLLPHAENYRSTAVEALRTNIAVIFDAIALNNPYPALYFNDQEWNQMYLKAAFMQQNLQEIMHVDERANKELTRIISDYAHERWAASRKIDPLFWRPVTQFLDTILLKDMERLLKSEDVMENRAGALCCYHAKLPGARTLISEHIDLVKQIEEKQLGWDNLKKKYE
ncbi:MAG: EboA domain-containing protein [Bacteroidota bacterium]